MPDGDSAGFSITAAGTAPLSYQWQRDGAPISGATEARYTTPPLKLTDSGGKYQVVVTGPGGSISSSVAVLTVTPIALSIAAQPQPRAVPDGSSASFSVQLERGSEPVSFQWLRDGEAIPGAAAASYTTPILSLQDSGAKFQVRISNPAGIINSEPAALSVTPVAPSITMQPQSLAVADRATVQLQLKASGSAPLSYQWRRNGQAIPGATEASYGFVAAYGNSGDRYSVLISNAIGSMESQVAAITVNPLLPAILGQPQKASISTGAGGSFTVSADGTAPLRYQWQRSMDGGLSWNDMAGATTSSYRVSTATLADAGALLRAAISNPAGTVYSDAALLTVAANVRVVAGATGGVGFAEGLGSLARFGPLWGLVAAPNGDIFVADHDNQVIRRVGRDGKNSVYAGKVGVQSVTEGALAETRLTMPEHLTIDGAGNLYVSEQCSVRKISADGVSSRVAGYPHQCGFVDGQGSAARFDYILGLAADVSGNVYVSDAGSNQALRKISPTGLVSTVTRKLNVLGGLTLDASGKVLLIANSAIFRVDDDGEATLFAGRAGEPANTEGHRLADGRLSYPQSLAFDRQGNLFVTEYSRIVRIDTAGMVLSAAGFGYNPDPASRDGRGPAATIQGASGITLLPDGVLAFVDTYEATLRLLEPSTTMVTTLAGAAPNRGTRDGLAVQARFNAPEALLVDAAGNVVVADAANSRVRVLSRDGLVSTLAGSSWGAADGAGTAALMQMPAALAYDATGNLYVADRSSHTIRKISSGGVVSTVAGKANEWGNTDGLLANARFNSPNGLAVDSKGNIYVADSGNRLIRVISPSGIVSTLAGGAPSCWPRDGRGEGACFGWPMGLAFDAQGILYVADFGANAIRRVSLDGEVSTSFGVLNSPGYNDDVAPYARFNGPHSLAFDPSGNLYVSDRNNAAIRRITPTGVVSTVIGVKGLAALRPGTGGAINRPMGIAVLPSGRLLFVSEHAVVSD